MKLNDEFSPTKNHWPCACVKRAKDGTLKAIKMHPPTVKVCRVCKATKAFADSIREKL